jgi:hypothetical protein
VKGSETAVLTGQFSEHQRAPRVRHLLQWLGVRKTGLLEHLATAI